ncbi:MAG: AAA family ATPase [Thermoplasmatales archaeon]|nr:AAA family ATPase [Thermoplasmatales archaeon]
MFIKKIKVTNFKSFNDLEVKLGKFNVLIGANASGKSNFIQIFKFLKDIENWGLDDAISLQGGIKYLRNLKLRNSKNLSIKCVYGYDKNEGGSIETRGKRIKSYEIIYEFALGFKKKGYGFEIVKDELHHKFKFFEEKKGRIEKEEIGEGEVIISCVDGKINISLDKPEEIHIKEDDIPLLQIFDFFIEKRGLPPKSLLLQSPLLDLFSNLSLSRSPGFSNLFKKNFIYDFDPKLSKEAIPITGKNDLEENGRNLSLILKNILEEKIKRKKIINLVKDILPFISDLDVERFAGKSLLFKLQETYFTEDYLPAYLISDGTINITALILALYFEKKPLAIIEEPERNIHPSLLAKIIDMMKDASGNKQIIVTTHNPQIVKYAGLENILLVSRDKEGFSTISRPADKDEVKKFLKNEIGLEELYVQNLLG